MNKSGSVIYNRKLLYVIILLCLQLVLPYNNTINIVIAFINVFLSLLLVYKFKKNISLLISSLFIAYSNYSVSIGVYIFDAKPDAIFNQITDARLHGITLMCITIFMFCLLCYTNIPENNNIKICSKKKNHEFYFVVLLLIFTFAFGYSRSLGGRSETTALYEYSSVFFILAYYYTNNSKIKRSVVNIMILAYSLQSFLGGNRVEAIAFIFVFISMVAYKRLNFRRILLLGSLGILAMVFISVYRVSFDFSFSTIMNSLEYLVDTKLTFDTAIYAYFPSIASVALVEILSFWEKVQYFLNFVLYIFLGGSITNNNLSVISSQYFVHSFGHLLPSYFYIWFGGLGVLLISKLVATYYNFMMRKTKYDFLNLVSIYIVCTTPRWYLYGPSGLTRGVLLFLVCYFVCEMFGYVSRIIETLLLSYRKKSNTNIKNVIYCSVLLTDKKRNELFGNTYDNFAFQAQKYHRLFVEGLEKNSISIDLISSLPVNENNCTRRIIKNSNEVIGLKKYHFLFTINIPFVKSIIDIFSSFYETSKLLINDLNYIMIGDVLNKSVSFGSLLACKLFGIDTIGIVTDLPDMLWQQKKNYFDNFVIKCFDKYILLTDEMNNYIEKNITKKSKPYIVSEGMCDSSQLMLDTENLRYDNFTIMYAGSIHQKYGIKTLIDAFVSANIENSQLFIYGQGDFEEELMSLCKSRNNILYFGSQRNDIILKQEKKVTLLVNPRPSNEEFTKYSFPSKNLEYLSSGTPFLSTKLPGIPKEYFNYMYIFDDTTESLAKELKKLSEMNREAIFMKAKDAKDFVLNEKNNIVQTKKIINWTRGDI